MSAPKVSATVVTICGTVIVLAAIGAYMYLEAMGKPTGQLLLWIAGIIPSVLAYARSSQTGRGVEEVLQTVNGNYSRTVQVKDAALSALPPQQAAEVLRSVPDPERG
jgi:hypothetical protein